MSTFGIAFFFVVLIIFCFANLVLLGMADLKVRRLERSMNVLHSVTATIDFSNAPEAPPELKEVAFVEIGPLGASATLEERVARLEAVVEQLNKFQRAHFLALGLLSQFTGVKIWGQTKGSRP